MPRTLLVILIAMLIPALAPVPSSAQARWTSHVDASWVREIVERNGNLYIATGGGLLVYNTGTGSFTQYTNVSGLLSNDLTSLVFDGDGALYVGTADIGIFKLLVSGSGIQRVRSFNERIDGLASNEVNSVAVWNDDIVYGTEGGAGTIISDFPAALYRTLEGMPSNLVNDVLQIGDFVWMATDAGMAVLDQFGLLRIPSGGPSDAIVVGSDGQLVFVGTSDGAWTLDTSDSTWTQVGPAGTGIFSFHHDGQTMRAGGRRGFWEYQGGSNWAETSIQSVLGRYTLSAFGETRGLVALSVNEVYCGTGYPGPRRGVNLVRWNGTEAVDLVPNTPAGNDVIRLSVDVDGSVWASFFRFWVGKLNAAGRWVNHNPTAGGAEWPSSKFVNNACLADADGVKWFCTISFPGTPSPLDRLDDKLDDDYANDEWARVNLGEGGGDGLGALRFERAVLDPAGNRWFLVDEDENALDWDGIHILSRDESEWLQVRRTNPDVDLLPGDIVDVAFTATSAYIAIREYGVVRWDHGGYAWAQLSNLTNDDWETDEWTPDEELFVTAVEIDSDGTLWVGTSNGVFRQTSGGSERRFGIFRGFSAGLLSVKVSDLLLDRNEDLWVATEAGLNRISGEDENIIDAWSTPAEYQKSLSQLQYPFEVISPLVNGLCKSLALHPTEPILYVGTANGMSAFNFPEPPPPPVDLEKAYVYPNPAYLSRAAGGLQLRVENITENVFIEIYNLEGELVAETPEQFLGTGVPAGEAVWEFSDDSGFLVASGVYLVRIIGATSGNAVVKPISIIR